MNKKNWLNLFVWGLGVIGFIISTDHTLVARRTIENTTYSVSKSTVSKIKFGTSPKCGNIDCWIKKSFNDNDWDIVPLPRYDFRVHPEYNKGAKEGIVYYRIKLNGLKNLDCNKKHTFPFYIKNLGENIVFFIDDKTKIIPTKTKTDRKIYINEKSECEKFKKDGALIIIKSFLARSSQGIHFYTDFKLIPEDLFYKFYETDEFGKYIYGIYFLYSLILFFILMIYLFTPVFFLYEFYYICLSFFVPFITFILGYDLLIDLKYLNFMIFLYLSLIMLDYLIGSYNLNKRTIRYFYLYILASIVLNFCSYLFLYLNVIPWTLWNYFYTVKFTYLLSIIIVCLYISTHYKLSRKNDLLFFLCHALIGFYCIYDHISYFEPFWLLTGCLFFLNKKLLRMLDKQIIIKENENKLDEMITFKSIGKIFSSLIHDVKRPLTQAKSFLESDELSLNKEFIILEVIKKDLREVDNLVDMLLKVVGQNSSNREYIEVNMFIDKILNNYKIVHKSLSDQSNLYIPTSRDLDYAFGLLNTFLSEKNKNKLVHLRIVEKKLKFYLVINLPFNLFNKNFEYISEHEQGCDKKLVRSIHYKNLKWSFIKKVLSQHMDPLINSIEDNKQINRSEIFIRIYKRNVE